VTLRIVCAGYLIRYPLGGHTWHHLQYLVGLHRLGHDVRFVEEAGWPDSCVDPVRRDMTSDPSYGLQYMRGIFDQHDLGGRWAYVDVNGASYGATREEVAQWCKRADLVLDLSGVTWLAEFTDARRRALVDTDPVFTQVHAFGKGGGVDRYDVRFTYGENVHSPRSSMPTDGHQWLPTRQPVVPELWPVTTVPPDAPWSTVMSWSNFGERTRDGVLYGHKDREFPPYLALPRMAATPMELATRPPDNIAARLAEGGWRLTDPDLVSTDPVAYQQYLRSSRGEFAVAKHAYVSTRCGWFSDRSAGYLASGRPVVLQDTGFSDVLTTGEGLLPFDTPEQALEAMAAVNSDLERHGKAARHLAETELSAERVLTHLLDRAL
jgi:hypothetical protein